MLLSFTLCCAFAILCCSQAAADPSQRKHEHRLLSPPSSEPYLHRSSVTASPAGSSRSPQQQQHQPPIGFGSMFTQFLAPDQKQQQQQHRQQSAAVPPATGPSLSSSISSPEGRLLAEMPTAYCAPYGGSICKKYITPTSFVYYNLTMVRMGLSLLGNQPSSLSGGRDAVACYLILIVHLSSRSSSLTLSHEYRMLHSERSSRMLFLHPITRPLNYCLRSRCLSRLITASPIAIVTGFSFGAGCLAFAHKNTHSTPVPSHAQ